MTSRTLTCVTRASTPRFVAPWRFDTTCYPLVGTLTPCRVSDRPLWVVGRYGAVGPDDPADIARQACEVRVKATELSIPGAWEFLPQQFSDDRGSFLVWYDAEVFADALGFELSVAQANQSVSRRGVVRGVHWADVPVGQAKYVYCSRGAVLDVVVDLRVGSPTFGRHEVTRLDTIDNRAVYLAEGLGHAFVAMEEETRRQLPLLHPVRPRPGTHRARTRRGAGAALAGGRSRRSSPSGTRTPPPWPSCGPPACCRTTTSASGSTRRGGPAVPAGQAEAPAGSEAPVSRSAGAPAPPPAPRSARRWPGRAVRRTRRPAAADHDGAGDADQLGVGELDPGRDVRPVVDQHPQAAVGELPRRGPAPPQPAAPCRRRPGGRRTAPPPPARPGPCSSWCCSAIAATARDTPMP